MKQIKTFSLAFTYVGCFLGAGFISGQELWQFFGAFGNWGYVGFVLAALRWLLLGWLAADLPLLLSAQLLHAATFGCFHVTAVHLVQRSFGSEHQGQGQALYATLSGCGGALGALYAGYSWNSLGAGWTFTLASLAAAAAALLLWRRLPARV